MKKIYISPVTTVVKATLTSIVCASNPTKKYGLGDEEGSYHQEGGIKEIDDDDDDIWDDLDVTAKKSTFDLWAE